MVYEISEYKGDDIYNIDCTGDACVGDDIAFERATFSGSFRSPKFNGFERILGKIVKDSYGKDKQQHTFTLLLPSGEKMMIKGRNLYKNGTFRKSWEDELRRLEFLNEKHLRGENAREAQRTRKENID